MVWNLNRTNFDRNIAVVIGINNYQNGIHPLKTAVNDARAVADLLEQEYKYQEVIRLFPPHGEATWEELNKLLCTRLPEEIKLTDGDRLLFYFAGHGVATNSNDGPEGFILPQDAKLTDDKDNKKFFPMKELIEKLSKLDCHHLLVILDCCFAGSLRWSSTRNVIPIPEKIHREHYDRFIRCRAWQSITSAAHNQEALDFVSDLRDSSNNGEHSPFALALLDGLKDLKADFTKDGVITVPELYLYVRDRLISKDGYSELQTPGIWPLQKHDRGEFIFTLPGFNPETQLTEGPKLNQENNPYRGLQSFEERDSDLFFGRQQLINQLSVRVSRPEQQFTVVLGISGSGKSSLVKAGLISHLRKSTDLFELILIYACIITLAILEVNPDIPLKFLPISYAHQWEILEPMRPGESPFDALAKAILPLVETQDKLADNLKENPEHLSLILSTWSQTNPNRQLLLAIDQFEELITMSRQVNPANNQSEQKDDIQKQFLALLVNAIKNCPQLHIVLTLRSDFEPRFIQSALKEYWMEARFPVRAMNLDELRQAIEQPASEMALYFEPANLVNQLIDEVSQMPGALPLLSFTLSELYIKLHQAWVKDDKQERALTVDEEFYKQGGIAGSLSRRGNEIYDSLPDDAHRDTMRRVMLRMVALEGGEPVRRRVPLSELNYANKQEPNQLDKEENQRVKVVLESLDKARLVVSGQEIGEAYVEPAHDFLVKGWDKLQKWQEEEQENLLLQRRLTPAALDWKKKEQPPSLFVKTEPFLTSLDKKIDLTQDWLKQIQEKDIQQLLQEARVRLQSTTLDEKGQEQPSKFLNKTKPFLNLLDKTFGFAEDWLTKVRQKNTQENPREKKVQFLWNGNPYLDVLRKTLKSRDYWFNQVEAEFVQQSIWQRRRNVNLRWGLTGLAFLILSGFTLAIYIQLQLTDLREKAARSRNLLADRPLIALMLAIQATGQSRSPILKPFSEAAFSSVQSSLRAATQDVQERNILGGQSPVAISAEAQYIASTIKREKVTLWDRQGNKIVELPVKDAQSITFSPDGQKILTITSGRQIQLWTLRGNSIDFPLLTEEVKSVAFSPNGQMIVTSVTTNNQSIVQLWNLQGHLISRFLIPDAEIKSLAFSPNSQMIVTATTGNFGRVQLWNVWGNPGYGFLVPDKNVNSVAFSPNGRMIVAGSAGNPGKVWLWDLKRNKIKHFPITKVKDEADLRSVAFTKDSQKIIIISDGDERNVTGEVVLRLWNLRGKLIQKPLHYTAPDIAVSTDGQYALTGNNGGSGSHPVKLWDLQTNPINVFSGHKDAVKSVAISPDGQTIVSGGEDGTVRLWNSQGQSLIRKHNGAVNSVAISPDGQTIISASEDKTVRLWDIQGNPIRRLTHKAAVEQVAISPDSQKIVTVSDGMVHVWNMQGSFISEPFSPENGVSSIAFYDNDRLVIGWNDSSGSLQLWDIKGKSVSQTFQQPNQNNVGNSINIAVSPDGETIVAGGDESVQLWNRYGKLIGQQFPNSSVTSSVAFSSDGQYIVTGHGDNTVKLWDNQGNLMGEPLRIDEGSVNSVAIGHDGQYIVSGSSDGTVRLWRAGDWQTWLYTACNRLRYHPDLNDSFALNELDGREVNRRARATCQKYVWK